MKRAREVKARRPADEPGNWLLQLNLDLQMLIGEFLALVDLHAYLRCLFAHMGVTRHGEAIIGIAWSERQLVLLNGAQYLLEQKNTAKWPGWFLGKLQLMRNHLYEASAGKHTLSEVHSYFANAMLVAACRHYEVVKFVHDDLCERCRAANACNVYDTLVCAPCRDGLNKRRYKNKSDMPDDVDPYSWVGRGLVRTLCRLPRNTDVSDYAQHRAIRHNGNAKGRVYLLKDVLLQAKNSPVPK